MSEILALPPPSLRRGAADGAWLRAQYSADVSVIVVSYNTCALLGRTLQTLFASTPAHSLEVIVVDNGSTDSSVAMVQRDYPDVRCIANRRNLGHSGGCNQGMRLAQGNYLWLLNSDTIILPGAVDSLVDYLAANPHVGAAGSQVLNVDGTVQGSVKSLPTPMAALFGRHSVLTRLFPNNRFSRRYLVYLDQDFTRPFAVGSVSGCALLARREAIEAAGLMDERLFYWNDVDWCRAFWAAGYEVHCVPASRIIHDEHKGGSRTGQRQSLKSIIAFHRGAYLYYRKWHVTHPWQPNHLAAIVGLSGRALVVLTVEQLRWALRRTRTA